MNKIITNMKKQSQKKIVQNKKSRDNKKTTMILREKDVSFTLTQTMMIT
jgi:hypothetical protein